MVVPLMSDRKRALKEYRYSLNHSTNEYNTDLFRNINLVDLFSTVRLAFWI